MAQNRIGIIGGSGLYQMNNVTITDEVYVDTPFGSPSDAVILGEMDQCPVAFLPRHGKGHRILPHEINYRANIFALKSMGVNTIISVSAVGSMRKEIKPGDLVMVDQFVDRTKVREQTFFGNGVAAHVSFADPVCDNLRNALVQASQHIACDVHSTGTYVCIEGPMFSSRAESSIYRSWGVDVIGMTNYQEAKLAREAEICFATIALATDYDCWHKEEGAVDVAMVVATMKKNVVNAQTAISSLLTTYTDNAECACHQSLNGAIMTDPSCIPDDQKKKLAPILGKYFN